MNDDTDFDVVPEATGCNETIADQLRAAFASAANVTHPAEFLDDAGLRGITVPRVLKTVDCPDPDEETIDWTDPVGETLTLTEECSDRIQHPEERLLKLAGAPPWLCDAESGGQYDLSAVWSTFERWREEGGTDTERLAFELTGVNQLGTKARKIASDAAEYHGADDIGADADRAFKLIDSNRLSPERLEAARSAMDGRETLVGRLAALRDSDVTGTLGTKAAVESLVEVDLDALDDADEVDPDALDDALDPYVNGDREDNRLAATLVERADVAPDAALDAAQAVERSTLRDEAEWLLDAFPERCDHSLFESVGFEDLAAACRDDRPPEMRMESSSRLVGPIYNELPDDVARSEVERAFDSVAGDDSIDDAPDDPVTLAPRLAGLSDVAHQHAVDAAASLDGVEERDAAVAMIEAGELPQRLERFLERNDAPETARDIASMEGVSGGRLSTAWTAVGNARDDRGGIESVPDVAPWLVREDSFSAQLAVDVVSEFDGVARSDAVVSMLDAGELPQDYAAFLDRNDAPTEAVVKLAALDSVGPARLQRGWERITDHRDEAPADPASEHGDADSPDGTSVLRELPTRGPDRPQSLDFSPDVLPSRAHSPPDVTEMLAVGGAIQGVNPVLEAHRVREYPVDDDGLTPSSRLPTIRRPVFSPAPARLSGPGPSSAIRPTRRTANRATAPSRASHSRRSPPPRRRSATGRTPRR